MSSICPHNMVNFGPLATEIGSVVWGTPANFNWFRVLAALLHGIYSSGRQPNFVALNRGRHLCLAGRPSRWALTHISGSLSFMGSAASCGVLLCPAASCGFHADRDRIRRTDRVTRKSIPSSCVGVEKWKIDSHHHHHHHIQCQRRIQYIRTTHQLLCYATTHTTTFLQMHNNTQ